MVSNDSCPSKLLSHHSAENPAGTQGKLASKSLLYAYGNVDINIGKKLLVGLGVADNNFIQVEESSAQHCVCVVYGSIAMAAF